MLRLKRREGDRIYIEHKDGSVVECVIGRVGQTQVELFFKSDAQLDIWRGEVYKRILAKEGK